MKNLLFKIIEVEDPSEIIPEDDTVFVWEKYADTEDGRAYWYKAYGYPDKTSGEFIGLGATVGEAVGNCLDEIFIEDKI